jgi:CheY-like chemotaxis protein
MLQIYQVILLRAFKARVMTAMNGDEALRRTSEARPHLIISDINHPGLDGLEFTRQVRQMHPRLPIILISGAMSAEIRAEALNVGATACLTKPFTPDEFLRVLRRAWQHR